MKSMSRVVHRGQEVAKEEMKVHFEAFFFMYYYSSLDVVWQVLISLRLVSPLWNSPYIEVQPTVRRVIFQRTIEYLRCGEKK